MGENTLWNFGENNIIPRCFYLNTESQKYPIFRKPKPNLLMNPTLPIKIVIADDHELFRIGFMHYLQTYCSDEIEIAGQARNGQELIGLVSLQRPDVVITDIQMPVVNGIEACKAIKQDYPSTSVIAFSMFSDTNSIMSMLQSGANGYLAKSSDKEEMVEAIKTVSCRTSYYCSTISDKIYGTLLNSNKKRFSDKSIFFGPQEVNVMRHICRQLTTKEIADEMHLSVKTIDHYRQNIQKKIGARNVVGIALYSIVFEIVKFAEIQW
jgi:DNA-binding NarL/FixJ family response regulator